MSSESLPPPPELWSHRFQGLMPFLIREILLVSSEYDAFVLEEDGPLNERLFSGYSNLNLSAAPRITHARTVEEAEQQLRRRRFDLVVTVAAVEDGAASDVARVVSTLQPRAKVALLVFEEGELEIFSATLPAPIERVFLWTGDARTLIALIKLIEDAHNVGPDTSAAGVPVILVVEDSVRAYSRFLARLFPELLEQSQSLIAEGGNPLHRILRMRARPRILLATNHEAAMELARRYRRFLLALISDLRFPIEGQERGDAGLTLVRAIRRLVPELPALLLTAEQDMEARAEALGASLITKGDTSMQQQLRSFMRLALGFGDFVFRMPDGAQVDHAENVYELEQALTRVPLDSLVYHAIHHHYSVWLRARGMFDLASKIRPREASEFADGEAIRRFLIDAIRHAWEREHVGTISDLAALPTHSEQRFVRVGSGSLGGKARGIAFVNRLIARHDLVNRYEDLQIRIPKTVVIGTDEFERFRRFCESAPTADDSDTAHIQRSLEYALSEETAAALRFALRSLKGPLAIRSSSVLEDARALPFAGVYATYMLANDGVDPEQRYSAVEDAVRAVFASVFMQSARTYLAGTPHALEDQRMGVVIQPIVGAKYPSGRFYPVLSGVAQSYDYYPAQGQRADDGVVHIALGLGQQVVDGGASVRFCPSAPDAPVDGADARSALSHSQSHFYAVDLSAAAQPLVDCEHGGAGRFVLEAAREDGLLSYVASFYDAHADMLRDSVRGDGPPVVTFRSMLRYRSMPLAVALTSLLELLRDSFGSEVEMEFAVDCPGVLPDGSERAARLYVLQVRPLAARSDHAERSTPAPDPGACIVRSERALGDGRHDGLYDVVYVRRATLTPAEAQRAAVEVKGVLASLDRPFVLIGPGRWGTSDAHLGIPVSWPDIRGVRVLIEIPMGARHVEPSQGSHFFRNLVADRVAYLAVENGAGHFAPASLDAQAAESETDLIRHVRLATPLSCVVRGSEGAGTLHWSATVPRA